ncbi:MAG: arginine--tRNA ligase [Thermoguttaceae bacterium]|jgi:arginyl-tRNA synthetase|nr:arginine--tRNA ligase [Thermoguttaceae bacterium]
MSILPTLKDRFRPVLADLVGPDDAEKALDLIRPAQDARFGDYQANMAMPLGKQLKRPPREVAAAIVERLRLDDLCEAPTVAGPGFINLRVRDGVLAGRLGSAAGDDRLGVEAVAPARSYVVDYSAPNVAKPMHVGHIRSTVIGDALCRVLRFLGHRVVSDNHLGDWGTQFGMILYGYKHFLDAQAYADDPLNELARVYRHVRGLMDADEAIGKAVLAETASLHAGDPENRRLWQEFMPVCLAEIERMYDRLGVRFDHTLGESYYHDRLPGLVDELVHAGVARRSEGALAVFLDGHKTPMLIQKQDGAFLYATTDLATIRYRMETFHPDAILYVVDHRQSLHFEQLFAVARKLGYGGVELAHVSFGTVLGDDGRPFRTREGDIVGLESLLDEAVRRAGDVVAANDEAKPGGPELSPGQRQRIAETVGIGALKYADLAQNRTSDYVFSFDKMLAMNGNTGTYMQYAYARIRSIFRKGGVDPASLPGSGAAIQLDTPEERALGLQLLRMSEALDQVVADYRPNQLTSYLFDLAGRFTTFYEKHPVLKAQPEALRQSRLLLCDLTARTIKQGLALLGIDIVEQM